MCAVPPGLIARGNQDEAPAFHPLDFPLHNAQLRRIDLIVGRVDGQERSLDAFESRRGIVIARGIELVEHVVGIPVVQ